MYSKQVTFSAAIKLEYIVIVNNALRRSIILSFTKTQGSLHNKEPCRTMDSAKEFLRYKHVPGGIQYHLNYINTTTLFNKIFFVYEKVQMFCCSWVFFMKL